jgi:hypothetical protein
MKLFDIRTNENWSIALNLEFESIITTSHIRPQRLLSLSQ